MLTERSPPRLTDGAGIEQPPPRGRLFCVSK